MKSQKRKHWLAKSLWLGTALLVMLGVCGFLIAARMIRDDAEKLPSDLDRAKERGLPLTPSDIRALEPKVSPDENAAPVYRRAIQRFSRLPALQMDWLWRFPGQSPKDLARHQKALVSFQPTRELLLRAANYPSCDFGEDLDHGYPMFMGQRQAFPEEISLQHMAAYMQSDMRDRVLGGDLEGSFADMHVIFRMARHLPAYGTIFGEYWVIYTEPGVLRQMMRILQTHSHDPMVIDRLQTLARETWIPDLYKLIQTDFVLGRVTINRIESLEEVGLDTNTPKFFSHAADAFYTSPGIRQAFDAKFVKMYLEFFHDLPANREDWPAVYQALRAVRHDVNHDWSLDNAIARTLSPAYPRVAVGMGAIQAYQRILLTAIELVKTRLARGSYPATLPSLPNSIDPLSGKPLKYLGAANGFTLYSVGRNLKDDGGKTRVDGSRVGDDIVLRFAE